MFLRSYGFTSVKVWYVRVKVVMTMKEFLLNALYLKKKVYNVFYLYLELKKTTTKTFIRKLFIVAFCHILTILSFRILNTNLFYSQTHTHVCGRTHVI